MIELANLNGDIMLAILLFCDLFSILKMEQTCKYLRKVSLCRHLWLIMAQELDFDHAPNLLPHESLQSLSTDRLREMVIGSYRSYLNWSRPEGPKPTRSISFEIPVPYVCLVKLLPGGRYLVVLDDDGRFYGYDTDSQEQILFYAEAPPRDEHIEQLDCLLVDEGNTLVLAYGYIRQVDSRSSVTVVRFDIHSGTSQNSHTFTFAQNDVGAINDIVVSREVVVVLEHRRVLVCNWRTGEARMIVFERESDGCSSIIIHNHLCVVEEIPGIGLIFSAVVLSDIFRDISGYISKLSSTPYTSVRSQDVFQESTRVTILETSDISISPRIDSVSICTSSWKTPSMCEHDAPATPTRILFLACIGYGTYMVSELLFSPAATNPLNALSMLSNADSAPRNEYLLTCRRGSLVRMGMPHLTSATRAGRLFSIYNRALSLDINDLNYNATAINMLDPLGETVSDGSITSTSNELFMGRAALTSPMDPLLNSGAGCGWNEIAVETYSGTMWYRAESTFFIHRTD